MILTNRCCTNFTRPGKVFVQNSCVLTRAFNGQSDDMKCWRSVCVGFWFCLASPELCYRANIFCFSWRRGREDKQIQGRHIFSAIFTTRRWFPGVKRDSFYHGGHPGWLSSPVVMHMFTSRHTSARGRNIHLKIRCLHKRGYRLMFILQRQSHVWNQTAVKDLMEFKLWAV